LLSSSRHHINHRLATIARGSDIKEHQFVGAFGVVTRRQFNGVASIAEIDEVCPFDNTTIRYVKTRDDAGNFH
jgi:hypothetical protein